MKLHFVFITILLTPQASCTSHPHTSKSVERSEGRQHHLASSAEAAEGGWRRKRRQRLSLAPGRSHADVTSHDRHRETGSTHRSNHTVESGTDREDGNGSSADGDKQEQQLDMELVIARNKQSLDWVAKVPLSYRITVYDKGGLRNPMPQPPAGRTWKVVNLTDVGGVAHTFATHLANNYHMLAAYTIFSHEDPLVHNKHFLDLLEHPHNLTAVQSMSAVYTYDTRNKYHTPMEAIEPMFKHPWYRSERTLTRTLNSAWYHDEGSLGIQVAYRKAHSLPLGSNLIRHHLGLIGLPEWMPEEQEICSFAFGGMVGVERTHARQHPIRVYQLLQQSVVAPPCNAFVIERIWLILFGGPNFAD